MFWWAGMKEGGKPLPLASHYLIFLKSWHFEASEDIITKFKSQGLYTIKIEYWNASGSGFPPSLIPALRNIGILHHKKAKLSKHLQHSVFKKKFTHNFASLANLTNVLFLMFYDTFNSLWYQWQACNWNSQFVKGCCVLFLVDRFMVLEH